MDRKEKVSKIAQEILSSVNMEKKAAVFESSGHSKIGPLVVKGESNLFGRKKKGQPLYQYEIGGEKKRVGFQIGGKKKNFTRGKDGKETRIGKTKAEKAAALFNAILTEKQASEEGEEKIAMEKVAAVVEKAAETFQNAQLVKQAADEYMQKAAEMEEDALSVLDQLGYEIVPVDEDGNEIEADDDENGEE